MSKKGQNNTKVNWYQASKELAERVVEFGDAKLWGIILRTQANNKINAINTKIENLDCLKGSILDDGEKLQLMQAEYESEIEQIKDELEEQLEKSAKFEVSANDSKFYKAYKDAKDDKAVKDALVEWVKYYGVDCTGTKDLDMLCVAISGARRLGAGGVVRSNGTKFTSDKRTKMDVLGLLYGKLCEMLVGAGTIKLTQIPEDVRAQYAKKTKKK